MNAIAQGLRRHRRLEAAGLIRLTWQDSSGVQKFVLGKCLDVSASGIRIEVSEPVPQRTYVTVGAEKIGLVANASVRHVVRKGAKYLIGMEFSCPIAALEKRLREEQTGLGAPSNRS